MAFFLLGCIAEEAPPPLRVSATTPAEGELIPADAPVAVYFDGHLAPELEWWGIAALTSGEVGLSLEAHYDPVRGALLIERGVGWRPGLGYTLTLDAERLVSYDGRALEADFELSFRAGPASEEAPAPLPDHREVLEARCGCHGPDLPPRLHEAALIDQPSASMPGFDLISPGRPLRSALLLRTQPGFSPRGLMPPGEPLSAPEALALQAWIKGLARAPLR